MRVGIIGSGNIATIHGPLILNQPSVEIVGIADPDLKRAKELSKRLNKCEVFESAEDMIKEKEPEVVHILTLPQNHAELSIMAMKRGCHVLVEKPMALNMADAKRMVNVAKENNVYLCVNHSRVFEETAQQAIELIRSGAIGNVISVEASDQYDFRRNQILSEEGAEHSHWTYKLKGGLLQDLFPHLAAFVFEFIPDIKDIHVIEKNRGVLPKEWQDEIRVSIDSEQMTGYISISLSEKPDVITFTIKGTKGTVHADLFNNIVTIQRKSSLPRAIVRGLSGFQFAYQYLKGAFSNVYHVAFGSIDKSGGIGPVITKFYEAIRNKGELPVSLEKSLLVAEMMERIWPTPALDSIEKDVPVHTSKSDGAAPSVLVTGASGFIGVHLVNKLLSENVRVRALVRPNSIRAGRLKKLDVDIIEGDLANDDVLYEASKGIKTVYHAGASMGDSWDEHELITIKGTEKLINASIKNNVERFVQFSTLAVYELLDTSRSVITEDALYQKNPRKMGPYAYAKIEAEKLVVDAYQKHKLGITIIRPGIVIGPLSRIFYPHLGFKYKDKLFIIIGKGDNTLPFTYIENTVDCIYKASINENAIGQTYNIVDDGKVTVRGFLDRFVIVANNDAKIVSIPYAIPYSAITAYEIASHLGIIKKGITSRAQLKWKQARVIFDNSKAKRDLGWETEVPLEEGLTRTFDWFRNKYLL